MNEKEFLCALLEIGISLSQQQEEQLYKYYELLIEWNQTRNLTSIIEKRDVYLKHFYDSLTVNSSITEKKDKRLLDIGTGAGFPGMVLKIVFPDLEITLVDSLLKRVEFLLCVKNTLNLNGINIYHARAEDFTRDNEEKFDYIVSRAVAYLPVLLEYGVRSLKIHGHFIVMKGKIQDELSDSKIAIEKLQLQLKKKINFFLPYEKSERTILDFEKINSTPRIYPRNNISIRKKPL